MLRDSRSIFLFLALSCILMAMSCSKNPITPERRTPRNYTWTRDTIGDGSYQSSLSGLWGSSPSDVYAVGHSSDTYTRSIWHFDGSQWADISAKYVEAFYPNPVWDFTPENVFGFSGNDVWIVGGRDTAINSGGDQTGFIMRLNGTTWIGTWLPSAVKHTAVWGISSNDLWVGGWNGQMFHFNGTDWSEYSLPDSIIVHHIEGFSSNEVYVGGIWFPGGIQQIRYYRWDGISWTLEESRFVNDPEPGFKSIFTLSEGAILSNTGSSVSRRISKGNWQTIFTYPNASFAWMKAFSPSNIVVFGWMDGFELVCHYNGVNWSRIEGVKATGNIVRAWSIEEEMFFVSADYSGSPWTLQYVVRGK